MDTVFAYEIIDETTGKRYIGSSGNFNLRIERHVRELTAGIHHNAGLQQAWNEKHSLRVKQYPVSTREEGYMLEQQLIDEAIIDGSDGIYNIGKGVRGGDNLTRNPNRNDIVAKIANTLHCYLNSRTPKEIEVARERARGENNPMFGKTHSEEARKKIADANRGVQRTLGYKQSEDFCKKMSDRGKLLVGERNPFFGKTHSATTKESLSRSAKEAYLNGRLPGNSRSISVGEKVYASVTEAARQLNVSPALIVHRLKNRNGRYSEYHYVDESPTTTESAEMDVVSDE